MSVNVRIPSPLFSYTGGRADLQAEGADLAALLADLDRQYPGMRFRIVDEQGAVRRHLRFFVNRQLVRGLDQALEPGDEVLLVAALSGG